VRPRTISPMTDVWVDPLTELPSWVAWDEALAIESARRSRYRRPVVVLRVQLRDLERVAERYGSKAKDELLRGAAAMLRHYLRAADIIARIDTDEFAVLMTETDPSVVGAITARLEEAAAEWHGTDDELRMELVMGWAAPEPFGELREAMRHARDRMRAGHPG
jgi:diguanylate cyclase (GGDEF)-like protein